MANGYDSDIKLSVDMDASDAINTSDKLDESIRRVFDSAQGQQLSTQLKNILSRFNQLALSTATTREEMEAASKINADWLDSLEKKYEKVTQQIEEQRKKVEIFNEIGRQAGWTEDSWAAYQVMNDHLASLLTQQAELNTQIKLAPDLIEQSELKLQRLTGKLGQLNNGVVTTKSRLADLAGKGDELAQVLNSAFDPPNKEILNIIELLKNGFQRIREAAVNVSSALIRLPFNVVKAGLAGIANGAKNAVTNLAKLVKSGIVNTLKRIASAAKGAATNLAKMVASGIKKGLSSLANSMLHLGKSSNSANFSLKKGIRTFIRYGLGMRSLFALVNKLRKALMDGLGQMAESYEPFGAVVTDLKNSIELLKGSFASMVAPILQQALPAITTFVNKISEGVTMVGKFIASLQGKSMFVQATGAVADTAKKSTKALKNTAKAAKEAQKELFGFDQINRFSKENDSDSGGDGDSGDSDDTPAITFEEVPIESMFADLAKRFKEMWENADFTELGAIIGQKLKEALEKIPWDAIKDVLRRIAKSIATFLNGFLEVPGLFETIGKTIAEALNSAFEFVNAFVTNFHWDSLGEAIRDLLNGVFTNIDWTLLYATLTRLGEGIGQTLERAFDNPQIWNNIFAAVVRGFNALVAGIDSFITAINWGSIAQNIGFGLNNAMDLIDWNRVGTTLTNAINALIDTVYYFFTTVDFFRFGTYVGETLSKVLRNVNWKRGGASVAAMVNSLMDALDGFVSKTDWGALGRAVIDTIAGFLGKFNWNRLGHLLYMATKGLLDALTAAFQRVDWEKLPGKITSAISKFLKGFDWKSLAESVGNLIGAKFKAVGQIGSVLWKKIQELGKSIVSGMQNGIKDELSSIGKWIKENIFDPFINGFKNAFGIASPSKKMKEQGKYIIEGLLEGITNALKNIVSWVKTNIFDKFMSAVRTAFGIVGSIANKLKDIGKAIIEGIKDGITSAVKSIGSWVQTNIFNKFSGSIDTSFGIVGSIATNLISKGKAIIGGIKSGTDSSFGQLKGGFSSQMEQIKQTAMSKDWSGTGSTITNMIGGGMNRFISVVQNSAGSLISAVSNTITNHSWQNEGSVITAGVGNGIDNNSYNATNAADWLGWDIANALDRNWSDIGYNICVGVSNGINNNSWWVEDTAWNLGVNAYNAAAWALGIASPSKVFRDKIGEMIPAGMAIGIENSESTALKAMGQLSNAVGNTQLQMPDIVSGKVIPYSAGGNSNQDDISNTLNRVADMLEYNQSDTITRTDLETILINAIQKYLKIDFYIGDEQIARHANAGNAKIDRRFHPSIA